MKKVLVVVLAILLLAGGAVWYFTAFKLDGMIKQQIEQAGTASFGTPVTVGSLETDLKNGSLTISGITVANPPGYKNANAFTLTGIEAAVDYETLEIKRVVIDQPEIVVEEKNGESNFAELLAHMEKQPAEPAPATGDEPPPVIVIHHFRMNKSRAAFESESLDHYSDIRIDEVELKNVRGTPAEVANVIATEVVEEVVSAAAIELLKAKASEKMDDLLGRD
jgi:hypothetical protein